MSSKNNTNLWVQLNSTTQYIDFSSRECSLKSVEFHSAHVILTTKMEQLLVFSRENKIAYKNGTGEEVIELSGLATDGNPDRSWAIACFSPEGYCSRHSYTRQTSILYVISGMARLCLDNQTVNLCAGEAFRLIPDQRFQILNPSDKEILQILIECTPAWHIKDRVE